MVVLCSVNAQVKRCIRLSFMLRPAIKKFLLFWCLFLISYVQNVKITNQFVLGLCIQLRLESISLFVTSSVNLKRNIHSAYLIGMHLMPYVITAHSNVRYGVSNESHTYFRQHIFFSHCLTSCLIVWTFGIRVTCHIYSVILWR